MSVSDETGQVKWISVHVLRCLVSLVTKCLFDCWFIWPVVTSHIGLFITGSFTHFVISHIGSLAL